MGGKGCTWERGHLVRLSAIANDAAYLNGVDGTDLERARRAGGQDVRVPAGQKERVKPLSGKP